MSIIENIKVIRKRKKLSQQEVANKLGITRQAYSYYERGERKINFETALKLGEIFDVSLNELGYSEPENSSFSIPSGDNIYMIPVYENVAAGFGAYANNQIIDYIPMYIKNPADANQTMCISVQGDSMYPKIEDGDIIQVLKQDSVDSGSIAVMLIDGEEGVVKKVMYGDDWIELISINPMYPPRRFEGAEVQRLRVVGLVKQVIKNI